MFYNIHQSIDPKVVGTPSTHIETMVEGYNYGALDSIYNWRKNKLPPNLFSFKVNNKSKLSDNMEYGLVSDTNYGLLVSKRLLDLINQFNTSPFQHFPAGLCHNSKEIRDYFYTSFTKMSLVAKVNLNRSIFVFEKFNDNYDIEVFGNVGASNSTTLCN